MEQEKQSFFKKYKKEIFIILLAILVFGLLFYFLFLKNKIFSILTNIPSKNKLSFNFGNLFDSSDDNRDTSVPKNTDDYYPYEEDSLFEGLIKVWDKPVAGYNFYYKEYPFTYLDENGVEKTATDTKTMLQFVDSQTGFIYEKDLLAPTSNPYQVTDNSYPNIVKAYFMNDKSGYKNRVFLQYLGEDGAIKTISATIPSYYGSTANLMNILSLGDNIKNFTVSPNNKFAGFVIEKNKKTNNKDDIYADWYLINNVNDSYGKRVFNSELSFWKLLLTDKGDVYAYTTETFFEDNSLYKLEMDPDGLGKLLQIFGNRKGMSFLINQNNLLTSLFTGSGIGLYTYKEFSGKSFNNSNLSNLNFSSLTNKCVQKSLNSDNLIICSVPKEVKSYDFGLPDAWYQGMTSWEDNLYLVNKDYPKGQLLFDFKNDGQIQEIIDGKNLDINESIGTHLAFINKNDGSLWTLNIYNILPKSRP